MPDDLSAMVPRMQSALPEFVAIDPMMEDYVDAVAPEIRLAQEAAVAAPLQLWPDTATSGIARLEALYGLPENTGLTLAERRRLIIAKMLAARTATVQVIRALVADLSNDQAVISYYPRQAYVWIKMAADYGKPAYLGALKETIDFVLPAHLEPHYLLYGQLTWGGLTAAGYAWGGLPRVPWAVLPYWQRGQHVLLWNELRQNIYKYGELTWGAFAATSTRWDGLSAFDPNTLSVDQDADIAASAFVDEDGYLHLTVTGAVVDIDPLGYLLARYGSGTQRLRVDEDGYLWITKGDA